MVLDTVRAKVRDAKMRQARNFHIYRYSGKPPSIELNQAEWMSLPAGCHDMFMGCAVDAA